MLTCHEHLDFTRMRVSVIIVPRPSGWRTLLSRRRQLCFCMRSFHRFILLVSTSRTFAISRVIQFGTHAGNQWPSVRLNLNEKSEMRLVELIWNSSAVVPYISCRTLHALNKYKADSPTQGDFWWIAMGYFFCRNRQPHLQKETPTSYYVGVWPRLKQEARNMLFLSTSQMSRNIYFCLKVIP